MSDAGHVRPPRPGIGAIFTTFLLIGAVSFGGGMVAYLREVLVRRRRWLDDAQFLEVLEIGQTLPGLNSTNVSVLVGDQLCGVRGAVAAFLGLMLPGATLLLAVGVLYGSQAESPGVARGLDGAGAAAVALLAVVTAQLGRAQVASLRDAAIALLTVVAVSGFHVPLPVVLAVLGPLAVWLYRPGGPVGKADQ
jgi:chromate transporter